MRFLAMILFKSLRSFNNTKSIKFQISRPMLEALVARNTLSSIRLKALKKHHKELMSKLDNN